MRNAIICSVGTINLFYTHEMTYQKCPVLLMCRDSIFLRVFPYTRQAPPRGSRRWRRKIAQGLQSERAPNSRLCTGRGHHLKPRSNSATREVDRARGWSRPADRKQTEGLEKRRRQGSAHLHVYDQPRALYEMTGGGPPAASPAPLAGEVSAHF